MNDTADRAGSFERSYYDRPGTWVKAQHGACQLERARLTVEMLPKEIRSVLDVGCGSGPVTNLVAERFPFTVGVDIAWGLLNHVQPHKVQASVFYLPFREESFDVVVSTELIEHLPRKWQEAALSEIKRVAKSYTLLSVPFREALEMRQAKCAECGCIFHIDRHVDFFTEEKMENLLYPDFKCVCLKTLGRMDKRVPRLFSSAAHMFGGYAEVREGDTLCPQCGNDTYFSCARNLMARFFWGVPLRILPLKRYPRWIIALYKRKGG